MIHTINVRNVNGALLAGLNYLKAHGVEADSRAGPVITAPGPVVTVYQRPDERVLFNPLRDANPFFHLYEAIYYLAGGNRVEPLAKYTARMRDFTDDGEYLHGAYGFRWREWFGFDQLAAVIKELRSTPHSRRAVVTMWSPAGDLIASEGIGGLSSKDLPCNTHLYLRRRRGALDMTVVARSADMIWGAYGANAVHFSFLQEWLAAAVGVSVGRLYQFSNDYHIYRALPQFDALWDWAAPELEDVAEESYAVERVVPLVGPGETAAAFVKDCEAVAFQTGGCRTRFMHMVVEPLLHAHGEWRAGRGWQRVLAGAAECDWKTAAVAWLERRDPNRKRPRQQLLDAYGGTMSANERQVGGAHYKVGGEEHWDRVARLGLDYFQAQITKYVERWRQKGGVEDLRKAAHFLEKYIELAEDNAVGVTTPRRRAAGPAVDDGAEPGPGYVNQDPDIAVLPSLLRGCR